MFEQLDSIDRAVMSALNGWGYPYLNEIMIFLSAKWVWVPLYAFFIYLFFRQHGRLGWIPLVGVLLAVTMTDQLTASFMKPFFERLRPCHQPDFRSLIHVVDGCGGKFGFASSHAANAFVLAGFMVWTLPSYYWLRWVLLWAFLVSYSRIYLGVHYPGDVLVGALLGLTLAWLMAHFTKRTLWAFKNTD